MEEVMSNVCPGVPEPAWETGIQPDHPGTGLRYDALALGLIHTRQPAPDEILRIEGWQQRDLVDWCETGFEQDRLLQTALARGVAVGAAEDLGSHATLPVSGHALTCVVPEAASERRWWWLQLARADEPFSGIDRKVALLLLHHWQVAFNHVPEPGMGRLLLGQDLRLIASDPGTRIKLLRRQGLIEELVGEFQEVIEQRWPRLGAREGHDLAVTFGNELYWLCFLRDRAMEDPRGGHWLVEIRKLEEEELPCVGPVEDGRIARAIAYLHDHFQDSPGLSVVADAVRVSPFHFHRLFSRQVGVSPKHYLQQKQLQVARWLLRSSRRSIGDIARETGFSSHGHFTSTFHRLTGVSPSDYRETS